MTAKEIFPLLREGEGRQGFFAVLLAYKENYKFPFQEFCMVRKHKI